MKNNVILVTGGAGYIGSHTCKQLRKAGYIPVVFDHLERGHAEFVKWGPLEVGDLRDSKRLQEVFKQYQPEAVLHFAAYAYVGESVTNPLMYYRNNVAGFLNLLEAMELAGNKKIVLSSSCAVYGIPQDLPVQEDNRQNPINPYGNTKSIDEMMLRDFSQGNNIKSISLRYFNAAGADPECEIGEDHNPETHLIPLILDAAAGRGAFVDIFGSDYSTADGTCIRDYVHVSDLANAHVLALEALQGGCSTTSYNLCNGHGYSILEIIQAAQIVTGKQILYKMCSRRVGDPDRLVGDSSKALRELSWKPLYPSIQTILEHAWRWHKKRFQHD